MSPVAGIVLAGGRSSRMGRPKEALEWHGTTLLGRVCEVLGRSLDGPVVVVRAPGQELPALAPGVEIVEDEREGRGPLQGLAAGLAAVVGAAETVYVSATDVPLLSCAFVRLVTTALGDDADAAVPAVAGRMHPLAAAYCTSVLPAVERLIEERRMRALDLLGEIRVRWLDEDELRTVDPTLDSLRNVNTPEDYARALALAGRHLT